MNSNSIPYTGDRACMAKLTEDMAQQTGDTDSAGKERRRHIRYRVSLPVHIKLSSGELAKATAVDISSGGIYVEYGASADQGRVLEMLFDLPFAHDFQRVYVKAEVVRSLIIGNRHVYGIAFNFIEFARGTDKVLMKYLELRGLKQAM
jgi:c-di-GMP-binding flagellar brake protein YcgR